MEFISKIMPLAWQIVGKNKKCAVNISTIDNMLTVSILLGRRKKRFSNHDGNVVLTQLKQYLVN